MFGDRPEAGEQGRGGGRAEAATVVMGQQFPADLVDHLAGLLARPVADRADDLAAGGDAQHLDVAGPVVGEG